MAAVRQSFLCWCPATIWPLAENSPADWPLISGAAVMKERQGVSHLASADDEWRADEWISGSVQKTAHRGNKCSQVSKQQLPRACGFRSMNSWCNDGRKKSSLNHLPVRWVFPWCYFSLSSCRGWYALSETKHFHLMDFSLCGSWRSISLVKLLNLLFTP